MMSIPREVAKHALRLVLGSKPTKQRLRRFDDERCRAIGEEITKLLAASFLKEVYHSDWLANPILVKRKTGKWTMCVDYTGLNKACPKGPFSSATHRLDSRLHLRVRGPFLSGCLLRLSLDHDDRV